MDEAIKNYLKRIGKELARDDSTEHTHRLALQELIQSCEKGITATNEPKRVECGAPDFRISRNETTVGYIETKDVGADLKKVENSDQLNRYRHSLSNLILTDYLDFRWYVDGECRAYTSLGEADERGKITPARSGHEGVASLIKDFLSHEPVSVSTPKELASRMARITHQISYTIVEVCKKGQESPLLRDLRKAFAMMLIHDLDQPEKIDEFADMFSQTIAYGLFAARCNHWGKEPFKRLGAATEIPQSNPFLKQLFEIVTGTYLDDEPYSGYVDDLASLLAYTDMNAVLEKFGKRAKKEDPIVHFYETFLAAYDPKLRERRGVYYTPEPVVSYIVRSVDQILKTKFDSPDGLADRSTIKYEHELIGKEDGKKKKLKTTHPKVLILDPACGTGTFLYAIVDHIRDEFNRNNNAGLWNSYVEKHLIPRLFGFELMMAPYAVAHMKLGMQFAAQDQLELFRKTWKYEFHKGERLNIYLTNTLEQTERKIHSIWGPLLRALGEEANAAAKIKTELPIMVVMGNPPYSGHSANKGEWIEGLVRDYYEVDGKPLGERNPKWLQDDYVKFIRFAQWRIENTGRGVVAMITNHGYLDNPTFRGMRQQLMKTFDEIYILNLHGNYKKKEVCPDGSKDDNVFDIQQGVAIGIFIKNSSKASKPKVNYAELWGLRQGKYKTLFEKDIKTTKWKKLTPNKPHYLFIPMKKKLLKEYEKGWKITEIMPTNSIGIVTSRDHFVIDFDEDQLKRRINDFLDKNLSNEGARRKFLKKNDKLNVEKVRKEITADKQWRDAFPKFLYRPFDKRSLFYHDTVLERTRHEVMRHLLNRNNIALICKRQSLNPVFLNYFSCSKYMVGDGYFRADNKGRDTTFPLYLYPDSDKNGNLFSNGTKRHVNFAPKFITDFEKQLGFKFIHDGQGDLKKTFGPEDVFHYMYAIFHSPTYRERYAEFLKIDFPRVPLTSDKKLFRSLAGLGNELTGLHLMESGALSKSNTSYPVSGEDEVETVRYDEANRRVYINKDQYFDCVPMEVWEFRIGGYQVSEKWLKDRKGRKLTNEDLTHYQKIIVALQETMRLMGEIDKVITKWPIE